MPKAWLFLSNHMADVDYYNAQIASFPSSAILSDGVQPDHATEAAGDKLTVGYPVRLRASAGYMRAWGTQGRRFIGDQTVSSVTNVGVGSHSAHAIVGVLYPFRDETRIAAPLQRQLESVPFTEFDWLGWTEPPPVVDVLVVAFDHRNFHPPTAELPILQTNVDTIVKTALKHGAEFAAEWLDEIQWWWSTTDTCYFLNDRESARRPWVKTPNARQIDELLAKHPKTNVLEQRAHMSDYYYAHQRGKPAGFLGLGAPASPAQKKNQKASPAPPSLGQQLSQTFGGGGGGDGSGGGKGAAFSHMPVVRGLEMPPPPPRAVRHPIRNFIFGFGSIINTASRAGSDASAVDAAPCRVKAEWGYVREWNFQASTAQICALGLRKIRPGEVGATINGVIFPAAEDMNEFDKRENGYMRVEVVAHLVEMLSWHALPDGARVFAYVPYAPAVVAKYGHDPQTGYPLCSGATPPAGLLPSEAPGLGLRGPSISYPILQTYVDVCLAGCLEYGEDFAKEFIMSTFLWSRFWLNDRVLARRPWVHQQQYVKIDAMLKAALPQYFLRRRLESEYACLFDAERAL